MNPNSYYREEYQPCVSGRKRDALFFFAKYPLFTPEEFAAFRHAPSLAAVKPLLSYHRQAGHITSLRRGLYASAFFGEPDPLLVAAKLTPDATLAYSSALAWHGLAHSLRFSLALLSRTPAKPAVVGGGTYRFVTPPSLMGADAMTWGVETEERQGIMVRVTGLERTLVDCLDRPTLCGGWEEVILSLAGLAGIYLDGDFLLEYALALRSATLVAKVGFFLETNRTALVGITNKHLDTLRPHAPRTPHYAVRERRGAARLIPSWNLLIPVVAEEAGEPL